MGRLQDLIRKILGIKEKEARPAKSVAFEAEAQRLVDEMRNKGPFEAEANAIRKQPMFEEEAPINITKVVLNPIGCIGALPPGTSVKQYLALYKDPQDGDTVFIDSDVWAWLEGEWHCQGSTKLKHVGRDDRVPQQPAHRQQPAVKVRPVPQHRNQTVFMDEDPVDITATAVISHVARSRNIDTVGYRHSSSSTHRDTHRHEDSTPSHHHRTDDSHHDHGGSDNSSGFDGGGSSD